MPINPQLVVDLECETGEGPLWHPDEELLYWSDIPRGRLYAYDPRTEEHELVYNDDDERIGGFTVQENGALLLFQEFGAVRQFDPSDGRITTIAKQNPDQFSERFNDVIADPEGRVFCGVMPDTNNGVPGQLYRLNRDGSFELVCEECGLPNGMGFSPDLSQMYFTDSGGDKPSSSGYIYRYKYDRATGSITDPEVFLEASDFDGKPDGLTVDAEGHIWSAFWNGNSLVRFAPDGTRRETVQFDPKKVSSVTFAGKSYNDIYVTTACIEGREREGRGAGSVFRVDLDVSGREEFRSKIEV
ncbi:SMP-30/gluconolactonase/LRE family protein [Haloprofundus halobius]|uniref:SMP-30/gluconolactonase/LRE family protein n=1 Tax=Haloprofundus halobius TaxID=2876194 RepID=UPI001CC9B185|nr:SMP-30/gluconolactonase/LRE family protein [Haloprofundus halobius]